MCLYFLLFNAFSPEINGKKKKNALRCNQECSRFLEEMYEKKVVRRKSLELLYAP